MSDGPPIGRMARATDGLRRSLVPLALTSVAGFLSWAGALLLYDASGGIGPLAPIRDLPAISPAYTFFVIGLAPIVYAVATWRLNARGALIALVGIELTGPTLWSLSPWASVDAQARLGYFDETRGLIGFGLVAFGLGWFFVIPPLTYLVRGGWRRWQAGQRTSDRGPA
jgi:hypothetical protein